MGAYQFDGCGSYFAKIGNLPIFIAENGNIGYVSTDFEHKNSDGNGLKSVIVCMGA